MVKSLLKYWLRGDDRGLNQFLASHKTCRDQSAQYVSNVNAGRSGARLQFSTMPYLVCAKLTCRRTVLSKLLTALSPKFRLARTTAGKSYRGLSTGKEQPVRLLLVDQPVVIRDRLDADLLEDLAECIGER